MKTQVYKEGKLLPSYEQLGTDIGNLVERKNESYGDSFSRSAEVLRILYPNGVGQHGYRDLLAVTRVIDKLFRIANRKDAFGESPWQDIVGYGLLGVRNDLSATPILFGDDKPSADSKAV